MGLHGRESEDFLGVLFEAVQIDFVQGAVAEVEVMDKGMVDEEGGDDLQLPFLDIEMVGFGKFGEDLGLVQQPEEEFSMTVNDGLVIEAIVAGYLQLNGAAGR